MKIHLKTVLVFSFLLGYMCLSFGQSSSLTKNAFEDIDSLMAIEERPVVVFIHTDWCKFCKSMKKYTLTDKNLIKTLNSKFYYIDFNAETKEPIIYGGQTFEFIPMGHNVGTHQLAKNLATINGRILYPTLCILNSKNEIIYQYAGWLQVDEMEEILEKVNK